MPEFSEGEFIELYPTIPSRFGGSIAAGARGIIREIDLTRPDGDVYLVAFLEAEQRTGETELLRETDLIPA